MEVESCLVVGHLLALDGLAHEVDKLDAADVVGGDGDTTLGRIGVELDLGEGSDVGDG